MMDVETLKVLLSMTTLSLVLAVAYRELVIVQNEIRRRKSRRG